MSKLPRTVSEDSFQEVKGYGGVRQDLAHQVVGSLGVFKQLVSFMPQEEAVKMQQLNKWFYEHGVNRVQFTYKNKQSLDKLLQRISVRTDEIEYWIEKVFGWRCNYRLYRQGKKHLGPGTWE